LVFPVVVRVTWNTYFLSSPHERLTERMLVIEICYRQRSFPASEKIIAFTNSLLAPFKIGQYVCVTPPVVATLSPAIEIHSLATIVYVTIDRRGPTKGLATRHIDVSISSPITRLSLIKPIY
jgi:hypothetical protein